MDRLLEAFLQGLLQRQSRSIFRESSLCFMVAFAVVLLNTDLHEGRLKSGTVNRQPMTEAQFINNPRGVDSGHDFSLMFFLETLYRNICGPSDRIEWKEQRKPTRL